MSSTSNYLEFVYGIMSRPNEYRGGTETVDDLVVSSLVTPPEQVSTAKEVVVNDERLKLKAGALSALVRAITKTNELQTAASRVDCVAFSALLCGGEYQSVPDKIYRGSRTGLTREIRYAGFTAVNAPGLKLKAMRPIMFGAENEPRFRHMAVRLPVEEDLLIQKFGDSPITLANLATSAMFYDTPFLATVQAIEAEYLGKPVITYRPKRVDPGPHRVYTAT